MPDHAAEDAPTPVVRRSDGYRVPWAFPCDAGGAPIPRSLVIPAAARRNGWYCCPACRTRLRVVPETRARQQHFKHPHQEHTCNTDNFLHDFAIEAMERLVRGAARGLVDIDIARRSATHRLPTADDVATNRTIGTYNYDLVLYAEGQPIYLIEIFHTNQVQQDKAATMPCSWCEISAQEFLRPDIATALAQIDAGQRCAQPLVLPTKRHNHRDMPPPGDPWDAPDPPPERVRVKAVIRAMRKLHRRRPHITLWGIPCTEHPHGRLQWDLPNTAWDRWEACDGPGQPHVELRLGEQTVLGIFFAGDASMVRGIPGRELQERPPYPLAILSTRHAEDLAAGRPAQVNAHAIIGSWYCPLCRAAEQERKRLEREQVRREVHAAEAAELEAWAWRTVNEHADPKSWGSASAPASLVSLIERHLQQWDAEVRALVPSDWYARASERDRRFSARHWTLQDWKSQLVMWSQAAVKRIAGAIDRRELQAVAHAVEADRPRSPVYGADVDAHESSICRDVVEAAMETRRAHIEDPAWRSSAIWDRFESALYECRELREYRELQDETVSAYQDIAAADTEVAALVATRISQVTSRISSECQILTNRIGDDVRNQTFAALGSPLRSAALADLLTQKMEVLAQIPSPTATATAGVVTEMITSRVLEVAQTACASVPTMAIGQMEECVPRLATLRQSLERIHATAVTTSPRQAERLVAMLQRIDATVTDIGSVRARHAAAAAIWPIWMSYRAEIMSRLTQPWGEANSDAVRRFRSTLRESGTSEAMLPSAIGAICAAVDAGDIRHLRAMCRDAQPPAPVG